MMMHGFSYALIAVVGFLVGGNSRALAQGILIAPDEPVQGERVLLSIDEYLAPDTDVAWTVVHSDDPTPVDVDDTPPYSFAPSQSGRWDVSVTLTRSDGSAKNLNAVVRVLPSRASPAGDAPAGMLAATEAAAPETEPVPEAAGQPTEVTRQVIEALEGQLVSYYDSRYARNARDIAAIYLEFADNDERFPPDRAYNAPPETSSSSATIAEQLRDELRLRLEQHVAPFNNLPRESWLRFFEAMRIHLRNAIIAEFQAPPRGELDRFATLRGHKEFLREIAQALNAEAERDEEFIQNYETYQNYVRRRGAGGVGTREASPCWDLIFGF